MVFKQEDFTDGDVIEVDVVGKKLTFSKRAQAKRKVAAPV